MHTEDVERFVTRADTDPHVPLDRKAACAAVEFVVLPLLAKWEGGAGWLQRFGVRAVREKLLDWLAGPGCKGQRVPMPDVPEPPPAPPRP